MRLALALTLALAAVSGNALSAQTPSVEATATAVTATEARQLAEALAKSLDENFVFPEAGQRYAAALRTKAAAGGYDHIGDRVALAATMTADLQAVAADGHLAVFASVPDLRQLTGGASKKSTPRPPEVEKMGWIAPGIAFVRFNSFLGTEESVAAARQFVKDYAQAKTVILDIRTHRGGGLDEMDVLFPALFAEPTRLITMDTRAAVIARDGDPLANRATIKTIASPPEVVRQEHWALAAKPGSPIAKANIYVLTSGASASAAEHLALAMKGTGRGVVIGEATAGAGHFGEIMPLVNGFAAFIPLGRSYDPVTGQDWEGSGVAPNIAVAPERALVEALRLAGVGEAEAERLSAEFAPQLPMRRRAPRAQ